MRNILITIKKELKSFLRDKKTLASLFIYPLLIPAMIVLYGVIYDGIESEDKSYDIGVNYELTETETAIANELHLNMNMYTEDDLKDKYENKEIDAYILFAENKYTIYTDQSSTTGMVSVEAINSYLKAYQQVLIDYKLENEFNVNLEEAYKTFDINIVDLSHSNYAITLVLSISFTYVILAIALSCSNVAVQSTAAEKENGTMETILTFPISKKELIVGKYFSSVVLGFIASIVSLLLLIVGLYVAKIKFAVYSDFNFTFSFGTIFGGIVVSLITSLFVSGIALFLTALAKSYKEAQSKIGLINMLCMIPMFVGILEINIDKIYYMIPVCNSVQILEDLFCNNLVFINLIISLVCNIIYTILIVGVIIKTYNKEKVLFTN